jgi:hypothetical protein
VKTSSGVWVLATNRVVTTSSSSLRGHPGQPLAAAPLGAVFGQGGALDVARGGHRHDHVLTLDQVLVFELGLALGDLGPARHGKAVLHVAQFVGDDALDARAGAQDVEAFLNRLRQPFKLCADLVGAKRGQPLQPQIEDRARLDRL